MAGSNQSCEFNQWAYHILDMSRLRPEYLAAAPADRCVASDVLLRQEPGKEDDEDDDEDEDDGKQDDDDEEDTEEGDDGYSE